MYHLYWHPNQPKRQVLAVDSVQLSLSMRMTYVTRMILQICNVSITEKTDIYWTVLYFMSLIPLTKMTPKYEGFFSFSFKGPML